jgi:hypothetical protein
MKAVASMKSQSEGAKSMIHNIGMITDDICGRIVNVTPEKRKEVETAVAEQYISRVRNRVGSPLTPTPTWHKRMVSNLILTLNNRFDAFTPTGWVNSSKEERMMTLMTKRERTLYLKAKAAGSENPLSDGLHMADAERKAVAA